LNPSSNCFNIGGEWIVCFFTLYIRNIALAAEYCRIIIHPDGDSLFSYSPSGQMQGYFFALGMFSPFLTAIQLQSPSIFILHNYVAEEVTGNIFQF
jgi:hypothetical protein